MNLHKIIRQLFISLVLIVVLASIAHMTTTQPNLGSQINSQVKELTKE